jgi:glycosyltransferase involved in cell wall biosynthesis
LGRWRGMADGMTSVSAVVPNYNHGHLLPEAIGTLVAQTRPYDEIIVVDDGSTDDSVAMIEALASRHARLRLVRHAANRGAIAAMNTGLEAAVGSYVHFAAADDRFRPGLVARTLAILQRHRDAAFACGEAALTQSATGVRLGPRPAVRPSFRAAYFSPAATGDLLARIDNFVVTATTLFRRQPLVDCGGFDARLGSFADGFMARRLALTHGFCFTPAVLAEWRVDDSGYSRRQARDAGQALDLLGHARRAIAAEPAFPGWYGPLFERRWRFAVARLAAMAEPLDIDTLRAMVSPATLPLPAWVRRLPCSAQRVLLLMALTLHFRPTSLSGLVTTALARRFRAGEGA